MIALSGVRSSWLMFARKSLFARVATSAAWRARASAAYSRAFSSAIAVWLPRTESRRVSFSVKSCGV